MSGHAALRRNLGRAHGFEPLVVEGTIPEQLCGTLYRVGPGVFERFGVSVEHPFDADGVITAVRVSPSGARGAARPIETDGYRAEQAAGRRLYGPGTSWLRQSWNRLRERDKNTANTSAWLWGTGQPNLYALMEGGRPTQIDGETLACLGESDLGGVLGSTFSAHPHRVAELETSFNFGIRHGKTCKLVLYALPDAGPCKQLGTVTLPRNTLVHDFVATRTHLVFVICPVEIVTWRALLGIGGVGKMLRWKPELDCELIIVPLATPDRPQRIACEPFWVWHFANGFARGDELVLDLCRYAGFSVFDAIASGDEPPADPPRYQRLSIQLGTGELRFEAPLPGSVEFPRVHPRFEGREHQIAWVTHRGEGQQGEGIAQVGPRDRIVRAWTPEPAISSSEPIVVPQQRGRDEADVWVLSLCHDDERDRSFLAILDGNEPERGPVAKLWFDQTIPLTYHGAWRGTLDGVTTPPLP